MDRRLETFLAVCQTMNYRRAAEALHLTQRAYAYYESGQRMLPPQVLCALARYYGVSVDYLLGETDVRTRYPAAKKP